MEIQYTNIVPRGGTGYVALKKSTAGPWDDRWIISVNGQTYNATYNPGGWSVEIENYSLEGSDNFIGVKVVTPQLDSSYNEKNLTIYLTVDTANGPVKYTSVYSSGFGYPQSKLVCMTASIAEITDARQPDGSVQRTATVSVEGGTAPDAYNWDTTGLENVSGQGTATLTFYVPGIDSSTSGSGTVSVTVTDAGTPTPCTATASKGFAGVATGACPAGQHDDGTGACVPDVTTGPQPCASGYHDDGTGVCVPNTPPGPGPIDPTVGPDGCCLPGYYQKVAGGPCLPVLQFPLDFGFVVTFTSTGAKVEVRPFNVSLNATGMVTATWVRDDVLEASQGMSIEFALARGSRSEVHCTLSDGTCVVARKIDVAKSLVQ